MIFYKPHEFKFSDIKFIVSNKNEGRYQDNYVSIVVYKSHRSVSLYSIHFYVRFQHKINPLIEGPVTQEDIENLVNLEIKKRKYASVL